jgi:hypothetical protein
MLYKPVEKFSRACSTMEGARTTEEMLKVDPWPSMGNTPLNVAELGAIVRYLKFAPNKYGGKEFTNKACS